jgi:hypothetical protein
MSIQRLALMPGVMFAPGGRYPAKNGFSRHDHPGLAHSRTPSGDLHFYPDDNRRLRVPVTSMAWMIEDEKPGAEVPPPSWLWQLSSVTFRTEIPLAGRYVSLGFWSADKHTDVEASETPLGVQLAVKGGSTALVPWHSVATLIDKRIADIPPPPVDAFPVEEVTPSAPPKRTSASGSSRGRH